MKANKQKKIKINKSGFKRSRFNWSHDVNTTFTWGEVQPTQCKMLIPGSKTTMTTQDLIRLAPMVAPTFGRVKYKTFNQFVGMSEVFPNWDAMQAQEPKTTAYGTQVPSQVPSVQINMLSSLVLHGARCTLYWASSATDQKNGNYKVCYRTLFGGTPIQTDSTTTAIIDALEDEGIIQSNISDPYRSNSNGVLPDVDERCLLNLGALLGSSMTGVWIPLGIKEGNQLAPFDRSIPHKSSTFRQHDYEYEVTLDSADYIIESSFIDEDNNHNEVTRYIAFAFELSDYGKRIRKILQGCGYKISFYDAEGVSIIPLLAQYKAYFDVFGLQLYQGWETTACARLIKYIENNFITTISRSMICPIGSELNSITNSNCIFEFVVNELGNEWYTEDPDYIGAHMDKLSTSPNVNASEFISVHPSLTQLKYGANVFQDNTGGSITGTEQAQDENDNFGNSSAPLGAYPFIDAVNHGEVDAELLKRMYKWTNRNTILGRKIADLLRAQGLGKYVDECKSNFIGNSDTMVTISDVVSQSDTYDADSDTGAVLGQYGGRGLQYNATGTLVFENDVYGYWVTLATVVPEAGYTQGVDPTLYSFTKFDFYQPDFDALGMEATPKAVVCGERVINTPASLITGYTPGNNMSIFGFVPRMSKFKVAQNLVNGDFNRHGMRNTYMPYTLDKQLAVNDYDTNYSDYDEDNHVTYVGLRRTGTINDLPTAGNVWRTPTKYAWLGNFNRIFYNIGEHDDAYLPDYNAANQLVGFDDYNPDNFLSHAIYDVQCYAPMKPIEESYGLEEDEADHAGVEFVTKA